MPLSSYYRDAVLDSIVVGYASVHNGDPGLVGSNEITGGSYVRKAVTCSAASGGAKANSSDLNWINMPTATGIAYIGLWDAASGGNFLWSLPMAVSKSTTAGDTFSVPAGNLVFTAS